MQSEHPITNMSDLTHAMPAGLGADKEYAAFTDVVDDTDQEYAAIVDGLVERTISFAGVWSGDVTGVDAEGLPSWRSLQAVFMLPSNVAADVLSIEIRCLKRLCRQIGLVRWPYRKLSSLVCLFRSGLEQSADDACARIKAAIRQVFIAPDRV